MRRVHFIKYLVIRRKTLKSFNRKNGGLSKEGLSSSLKQAGEGKPGGLSLEILIYSFRGRTTTLLIEDLEVFYLGDV